jgi:hypothetical protein
MPPAWSTTASTARWTSWEVHRWASEVRSRGASTCHDSSALRQSDWERANGSYALRPRAREGGSPTSARLPPTWARAPTTCARGPMTCAKAPTTWARGPTSWDALPMDDFLLQRPSGVCFWVWERDFMSSAERTMARRRSSMSPARRRRSGKALPRNKIASRIRWKRLSRPWEGRSRSWEERTRSWESSPMLWSERTTSWELRRRSAHASPILYEDVRIVSMTVHFRSRRSTGPLSRRGGRGKVD